VKCLDSLSGCSVLGFACAAPNWGALPPSDIVFGLGQQN
jgi:hypothetical protein